MRAGFRRVRRAIALLVAVGALSTVATGSGPAHAAPGNWIDTSNRAAVLSAYSAAMGAPLPATGWSGNPASCNAGSLAPAYRAAAMARVNWYRSMAGVAAGVVDDATFSAKAQQAALIMTANNFLNHQPPSSSRCWTQDGDDGAANSNLGSGSATAAIDGWMVDPGSSNAPLGHRSWILEPAQTRMGFGAMGTGSAALYVIDGFKPPGTPTRNDAGFVSWPPPGFVPLPSVFERWSVFHDSADFTAANVLVTVNGQTVPVNVEYRGPGFASPTFTFVPALPSRATLPATADTQVAVSVTGIRGTGVPTTLNWTSVLIPPPFTPDQRFVIEAYEDFLRRVPTVAELDQRTFALATGASRDSIVGALASSDEWVGALVDRYYVDTLGRPGDTAGRAYWIGVIRRGEQTPAAVAANFYASSEYFQKFGHNDLNTWVADLYRKLLGREPDAVGQRNWVDAATAQGRPFVAANFFQSLESRRRRVALLFQSLLDRPPDASGHSFWAGEIGRTGNDVVLAASLAASPEYYQRAQN